jgi:hydrogenase maturation factor
VSLSRDQISLKDSTFLPSWGRNAHGERAPADPQPMQGALRLGYRRHGATIIGHSRFLRRRLLSKLRVVPCRLIVLLAIVTTLRNIVLICVNVFLKLRVVPGEFVVVHVGNAVQKIRPKESCSTGNRCT